MRKFQRTIEDFTCEHCGQKVKGNGYTDHCPSCLWSKHVDVNPGDRANACGGMMEPISIELNRGEYAILYKCQKCGKNKKNHSDKNDSIEALAKLSETLAKNTKF